MPDMPSVKLSSLGLIIAAVILAACVGPGPNQPGPNPTDGDRRGPPPFSSLDLNKDGQLTLDEFKSHEIPRGDHAEVFNTIDVDGDGIITQTEYDSHRPPDPPSRPDREQMR